jgi:hypothetical protein
MAELLATGRARSLQISRVVALARRFPLLTATLGYGLLLAGLFRELVFGGRVLFERDVHLFWYTQVESFVRIVTTPAWPLWDPYTSFGQPLLADPSAQVLYPLTWLNLLMQPSTFYTLYVVGHLTLTGLGTFRLSRALGLSSGASFAAGSFWILCGPMLSLVNAYHHFTGACWLPWIVLAAERIAKTPGTRAAALGALTLAAQVLTGSADMCALSLVAAGVLSCRHIEWRHLRASSPFFHDGCAVGSGRRGCFGICAPGPAGQLAHLLVAAPSQPGRDGLPGRYEPSTLVCRDETASL